MSGVRLWLAPILAGAAILVVGVRRLGLPYEDGRFFDEATGTVVHVQTAEVLVAVGAVLVGVGAAGLVWARVRGRRPQAPVRGRERTRR